MSPDLGAREAQCGLGWAPGEADDSRPRRGLQGSESNYFCGGRGRQVLPGGGRARSTLSNQRLWWNLSLRAPPGAAVSRNAPEGAGHDFLDLSAL